MEHGGDGDEDPARSAVGEPDRDQADRGDRAVGEQPAQRLRAVARLRPDDRAGLEEEIGAQVGEDQPREDEDGLGHRSGTARMAGIMLRHRVALDQRAHDPREPAELAEMGAVGGDRDRRPADTETLRGLRPAAAFDEHQPADLALTIGQVIEELAEERRGPVEEVVDPRDPADGGDPLAVRDRRRQSLAGGDEGRAAALGRGTGPGVHLAPNDHPAHRRTVGVERGPEDRPGRIGRRGEEALQLVALGELERRRVGPTRDRRR